MKPKIDLQKGVVIALGSNLGDSAALLERAIQRLQEFSVTPVVRSSFIETAPVDCPPGSPMFLNAVVALTPPANETPESLLEKLRELEKEFGRPPKTILNEPRPLDLDLIAFGNETRATPALILPHPRAHLRRFVLEPLAEIAADFILPGQTKTVAELHRALSASPRLDEPAANSQHDCKTLAAALSFLPHGSEFRFLDRVTALDAGQSGAGEHIVRGDEPFLRGHFPGHPLFPGVLLVEAVAQLAGVVAQSDPRIPPLPGLKLTAMRGIKILGSAVPGETIQLEARILQRMGNLIQARVAASVQGKIVMQGELTLSGDR